MSAKRKGSQREHKTIAWLEAGKLDGQAYQCTRAAGSLGAWDIIGVGAVGFVAVQVKSNRWPGRAEMATLEGFAVPANCRKLVIRWDDYGREPLIREV
jgi:hypothetical protein